VTPAAGATVADLEARWAALTVPTADLIHADTVRSWPGGAVLVARDRQTVPHLLVEVPAAPRPRLPRPAAGLQLQLRTLRVPGRTEESTWVDLAPTTTRAGLQFTALAADVSNSLPTDGPADPVALFATLQRWRRFWAGSGEGLTREQQLGLFGELWLLLEWLPQLTVAALTAWQGPLGGRHDFVSATLDVEVKTTGTSTGPVVHHISRLDQLEAPPNGKLLLLSLRVVDDPAGDTSLDALLTQARTAAAAAGPTCAALLDERLAAAQVPPADTGRYTQPVRLAGQTLYRVDDGFPRLRPTDFPAGPPPASSTSPTPSTPPPAGRGWSPAPPPRAQPTSSA